MGACETTCCGPESHNIDTVNHQQANIQGTDFGANKPFSQNSLMDIKIADEKQLQVLETAIQNGANYSMLAKLIYTDPKTRLKLLAKVVKTLAEYQTLCIKDAQLSVKAMDSGALKYVGQVRQTPVFEKSEGNGSQTQQGHKPEGANSFSNQSTPNDYENVRCGYGRLIWPDGSTFEGYWLNGDAFGVGVFRAPEPQSDTYEGFWQMDRQTNLSVFRQNQGFDIQADIEAIELQNSEYSGTTQDKQNGKGVEVWSDGSYYHGHFRMGVKQGEGCYFWNDGSRYSGTWSNDEMSGYGCFSWADGRYFQGDFQEGVMHGNGLYVWQDGRRYEGQYQYNKKHGDGTYIYSDGSKYRGEWKDGMQHGVGWIIDAQSTFERQGIWAFGKLKQWVQPVETQE